MKPNNLILSYLIKNWKAATHINHRALRSICYMEFLIGKLGYNTDGRSPVCSPHAHGHRLLGLGRPRRAGRHPLPPRTGFAQAGARQSRGCDIATPSGGAPAAARAWEAGWLQLPEAVLLYIGVFVPLPPGRSIDRLASHIGALACMSSKRGFGWIFGTTRSMCLLPKKNVLCTRSWESKPYARAAGSVKCSADIDAWNLPPNTGPCEKSMFPSTACFGSARAACPKVDDNSICLLSCACMNAFSVSLASGGAFSASLPASSSTQLPTRTPAWYSFWWLDTPIELLWNIVQALAVTTTTDRTTPGQGAAPRGKRARNDRGGEKRTSPRVGLMTG